MPNIKSAIKRLRQNKVRNLENRSKKSSLGTAERKLRELVAEKDFDGASEAYKTFCKLLDKAAKTNVIHKNKVNRKKSRLNALLATAK